MQDQQPIASQTDEPTTLNIPRTTRPKFTNMPSPLQLHHTAAASLELLLWPLLRCQGRLNRLLSGPFAAAGPPPENQHYPLLIILLTPNRHP